MGKTVKCPYCHIRLTDKMQLWMKKPDAPIWLKEECCSQICYSKWQTLTNAEKREKAKALRTDRRSDLERKARSNTMLKNLKTDNKFDEYEEEVETESNVSYSALIFGCVFVALAIFEFSTYFITDNLLVAFPSTTILGNLFGIDAIPIALLAIGALSVWRSGIIQEILSYFEE